MAGVLVLSARRREFSATSWITITARRCVGPPCASVMLLAVQLRAKRTIPEGMPDIGLCRKLQFQRVYGILNCEMSFRDCDDGGSGNAQPANELCRQRNVLCDSPLADCLRWID